MSQILHSTLQSQLLFLNEGPLVATRVLEAEWSGVQ